MKLNLACGTEYLEGFKNVDNGLMYPDAKVESSMDVMEMMMPLESVEHIRLSHFIMYIRPEELRPLLKRWYGWLEKGGRIEIEAPNIKKVCEEVLGADELKVEKWGLVNLYGNPNQPPHRWGWYPESLIFELYNAGFMECALGRGEKKPDRDFKVIAIK